jgi:hypothetical protein
MANFAAALLVIFLVGHTQGADNRFPLTGVSNSRDSFVTGGRDSFPSSNSGSNRGSSSSVDSFGFGASRPSSSASDFGDTWDTDNDELTKARIQPWSQGIVPYEIASDISDSNAAALKRMLSSISDKTCVTFVPHRNEANYTLIKGGSGCSAPLGVSYRPTQVSGSRASGSRTVSGASVVTLAPGCFTTKRVARRIINLLGIPHETSRPDRDQFVEINTNNIRAGYADNLKQYTASSYLPGVLAIPYDLQSVTQYTDEDLAKSPSTWAIRPKNTRLSARDLGGDNFSPADFDKINAAYNCRSGSRGSSFGGSRPSSSSDFGSSSRTRF